MSNTDYDTVREWMNGHLGGGPHHVRAAFDRIRAEHERVNNISAEQRAALTDWHCCPACGAQRFVLGRPCQSGNECPMYWRARLLDIQPPWERP